MSDWEPMVQRLNTELCELAEEALPDHLQACSYCHCDRKDLCRNKDYVSKLLLLVGWEQAEALGYGDWRMNGAPERKIAPTPTT